MYFWRVERVDRRKGKKSRKRPFFARLINDLVGFRKKLTFSSKQSYVNIEVSAILYGEPPSMVIVVDGFVIKAKGLMRKIPTRSFIFACVVVDFDFVIVDDDFFDQHSNQLSRLFSDCLEEETEDFGFRERDDLLGFLNFDFSLKAFLPRFHFLKLSFRALSHYAFLDSL